MLRAWSTAEEYTSAILELASLYLPKSRLWCHQAFLTFAVSQIEVLLDQALTLDRHHPRLPILFTSLGSSSLEARLDR